MRNEDRRSNWGQRVAIVSIVVALAAMSLVSAGESSWQFASKDESSWLKFGFLALGRAELQDSADGESTAQNLFFRRARILMAGQIGPKWSFFFETDSPNLGKATGPNGEKDTGDIFIQDFVLSYKHSDAFRFDAGMILVPFSHNSTQSAATLMTTDYGPYSFIPSVSTDSRVGRDYGVQAWGHVANDRLEYRAGIFQGSRGPEGSNPFRYTARVTYYPFEADKGRFYTGTSLGKNRILAVGVGVDGQSDYMSYAFDVFYEQPIGGGDGLTVQVAHYHYDGDTFLPDLPEQDVLYGEFGYYVSSVELMPFVALGDREFDAVTGVDDKRFEIGIAWYPKGYERVVKAAWARVEREGLVDRDQVLLQVQFFKW